MKKLIDEGKDIESALLIFLRDNNWRNHTSTKKIPAEMMFARPIKHELSFLNPKQNLKPGVKTKFHSNDAVWFRHKKEGKWTPGVIQNNIGNKLYTVLSEDGILKKLHEDQIRIQFAVN